MPSVSIVKREEDKAKVRQILTLKPRASCLYIAEQMDVDRIYVTKLVAEVRQERLDALNDETKEDIYTQMSDLVDFINGQLRLIANEEKIVYTNPNNKADQRVFAQNNRIKALNSIIDNAMKLANLKMDLGIIERKLGRADVQVIDLMSALKKIRNGDYSTPIEHLIPGTPTNYLEDGSATNSAEYRG